MTTRFMRLGLFGSMIVLLAVGFIFFDTTAQAQQEDKTTDATVVTGGVAPIIECKWELRDLQVGVIDSTFPDGVIQFEDSQGNANDDDPNVVPDADNDSGNGTQIPCTGPENEPPTLPIQPEGVTHMTQLHPNPDDAPEELWVGLYVAISHEFGISNVDNVFWDIYHPDGTLKIKIHGDAVSKIGGPNGSTRSQDCADLGNSTTPGGMFHGAVTTGQLSSAAVDDVNLGLVAKCQQGEKAIYFAKFSISKEQPCGEYRIEVHASSQGFESILNNYLDVICMLSFETDFDSVDWGDITPGNFDIVGGDLDMLTPQAPTVMNTGNHPIGISVIFDSLIQQTDGNGLPVQEEVRRKIDEFDACFGKHPSQLQCFGDGLIEECDEPGGQSGSEPNCIQVPQDPVQAGEVIVFGDDEPQILCSNNVGKLDLSIHPPLDIPAGGYAGSVAVLARQVHTNDQEYAPSSFFSCPSLNLGLETDQEDHFDHQGGE